MSASPAENLNVVTSKTYPVPSRRIAFSFFSHVILDGETTEVFLPNANGVGRHLVGRYDSNSLSKLAHDITRPFPAPAAAYWRINPVVPYFADDTRNQLLPCKSTACATSGDVVRRRRVLIDIDSKRGPKEPATDQEKQAAMRVLRRVIKLLRRLEWRPLSTVDSGNGFGVYLSVDLPVDDQGVVQRLLRCVADECDEDAARVDTSVHDAIRAGRVPGTINMKGVHSPLRPHRLCKTRWLPIEGGRTFTEHDVRQFIGDDGRRKELVLGSLSDTSRGLERARAYIAKMPAAVAGQGGHNQTYAVACQLVIGFDLPTDIALQLLAEYNQRCMPMWTQAELLHKLESAIERR